MITNSQLYGVNYYIIVYLMCSTGAGKTTTFSILTGDISPTDGTAFIAGFDIRTNLRKVYISMFLLVLHVWR